VLNVELVSVSVCVGDVVVDVGMISDVDPQPITLTVDTSSIELEFMSEYDTTFGDERVDDSTDDRSIS
jgi:hypothetical protein